MANSVVGLHTLRQVAKIFTCRKLHGGEHLVPRFPIFTSRSRLGEMWGAEAYPLSFRLKLSANESNRRRSLVMEKHPVCRRSLSRKGRKSTISPSGFCLRKHRDRLHEEQHTLDRKWINYAMLLQLQSRKNKLLCPNCTMHLLLQLASSFH